MANLEQLSDVDQVGPFLDKVSAEEIPVLEKDNPGGKIEEKSIKLDSNTRLEIGNILSMSDIQAKISKLAELADAIYVQGGDMNTYNFLIKCTKDYNSVLINEKNLEDIESSLKKIISQPEGHAIQSYMNMGITSVNYQSNNPKSNLVSLVNMEESKDIGTEAFNSIMLLSTISLRNLSEDDSISTWMSKLENTIGDVEKYRDSLSKPNKHIDKIIAGLFDIKDMVSIGGKVNYEDDERPLKETGIMVSSLLNDVVLNLEQEIEKVNKGVFDLRSNYYSESNDGSKIKFKKSEYMEKYLKSFSQNLEYNDGEVPLSDLFSNEELSKLTNKGVNSDIVKNYMNQLLQYYTGGYDKLVLSVDDYGNKTLSGIDGKEIHVLDVNAIKIMILRNTIVTYSLIEKIEKVTGTLSSDEKESFFTSSKGIKKVLKSHGYKMKKSKIPLKDPSLYIGKTFNENYESMLNDVQNYISNFHFEKKKINLI